MFSRQKDCAANPVCSAASQKFFNGILKGLQSVLVPVLDGVGDAVGDVFVDDLLAETAVMAERTADSCTSTSAQSSSCSIMVRMCSK
jgi:hypothetical protein